MRSAIVTAFTCLGLGLALGGLGACGKKKSAGDDASPASTTPYIAGAGSSKLQIADFAGVPAVSAFLASASATPSGLWDAGFQLSTDKPPTFQSIGADSSSIESYLSGDLTTLTTAIDNDRSTHNWADMKPQLATYFAADASCAALEETARVLSRLKEDISLYCTLRAVAGAGDGVFSVASGAGVGDLTAVFAAGAADKVLQLADSATTTTMIEIKGTDSLPSGYQLTLTRCDAKHVPTQQQILTVDNAIGTVTLIAKRYEPSDGGLQSSFELDGSLITDGQGGYRVDTGKTRGVAFASKGTYGNYSSNNQGKLQITGNTLNNSFFSTYSGTDSEGRATSGAQHNALSLQYAGTGVDDLAIYQGAAARNVTYVGTNTDARTFSLGHQDAVAFAFASGLLPKYAKQTTSTFLDTVVSVDQTKDSVLRLTTPTPPDVAMDTSKCTATPTTVLQYQATAAAVTAAATTCATSPLKSNTAMCDTLRAGQEKVYNGMFYRQSATGSAEQ